MKGIAILFQILGLSCRRSDANKWLRAASPRQLPSASQDERQQQQQQQQQQRTRFLRIDPVHGPVTTKQGLWEEDESEEVMIKLDQIGNFEAFEEEEKSIMDAFVIEEIEDPEDEEQDRRQALN